MKISLIDLLALAGVALLAYGSYCFDKRLLLVFAGLVMLWLARFLAQQEAARHSAERKEN